MDKKTLPFELTLVVTHHCNLNCIYCYEHNKTANKRMSLETAKQAVSQYLTNGNYDEIRIGFIGGEPLLEFNLIKELCEWTWSKNWPKKLIFYATTNGTVLTESMKQWFTANKKRFWLALSLDGAKRTHDINRCNSFDKIDLNFFLKNWPEQPVKMTISDRNLESLADDIIYIHNLGFKINGCNFAEGVEISDFDEKYAIIVQQYKKLIDFYISHPEFDNPRIFDMPLGQCELPNDRLKHCGTGSNMAVVDFNGKVYPCTYFSPITLNDEQLETIKSFDFTDDNIFVNEYCSKNCYIYPICHGCYGDNFSTTGSLKNKSKQKCELTKLRVVATANYRAKLLIKQLEHSTEISEKDKNLITAIQKINQMIRF